LKDNLKREGSIRVFRLLSGKNDYAVITREDYISSIRKFAKDYKIEQAQMNPSIFGKHPSHSILTPYLHISLFSSLFTFHFLSPSMSPFAPLFQ
jgi:hypothetical protein